MREMACTIQYQVTPANAGEGSRSTIIRQIDFGLQIQEDATPEAMEKAMMEAGLGEIGMVEGAHACYEVLHVMAMGPHSAPSVLWG